MHGTGAYVARAVGDILCNVGLSERRAGWMNRGWEGGTAERTRLGVGRGQREGEERARDGREVEDQEEGGIRAAHTSCLGLEKTGKSKMVVRPPATRAMIFPFI